MLPERISATLKGVANRGQETARAVSSAINRPMKRRDFLVVTFLIAAGYGLKDYHDAVEANDSQFELSPQFLDTLQFMQDFDIQPPPDTLYSFQFPSTKEMSQKYINALTPSYVEGNSQYDLVIVQEIQTQQLIRRVRQMLGLERPNHCNVGAIVEHRESEDQPDFLYLSTDFPHKGKAERAAILYHEGIHLFDRQGGRDEKVIFPAENKANMGELLLTRAYLNNPLQRHLVRSYSKDLSDAYDQAVEENNSEVWKTELLKPYEQAAKEVPTYCQ